MTQTTTTPAERADDLDVTGFAAGAAFWSPVGGHLPHDEIARGLANIQLQINANAATLAKLEHMLEVITHTPRT
jgi:hypothetical protein